MDIKASNVTAAFAGAWASFGMVPFEMWMQKLADGSILLHNVLWLSSATIFFLVPGYFFVLGRNNEPFENLTWFLDPDDRARYGVVVKRMFVWFVSAGAVGSMWSLMLSFVMH